jgi:hypothetical protein
VFLCALYLLFIISEYSLKKYPGRIVKIAMKTFQIFIKAKNRSINGSSENIGFRQYDKIINTMAILIQIVPTVLSMVGNLLICKYAVWFF